MIIHFIYLFPGYAAWKRNKNLIFLPCGSWRKLCVGQRKATSACLRRSRCRADCSCWERKRRKKQVKGREFARCKRRREREGERERAGERGFQWQRSLFWNKPLMGELAIKKSVMAKLSSAQVTVCTWALLLQHSESHHVPQGSCCMFFFFVFFFKSTLSRLPDPNWILPIFCTGSFSPGAFSPFGRSPGREK